jgi:hypothetical protein
METEVPLIDAFLRNNEFTKSNGVESVKFYQFLITGDFIWSKTQQ